MIQFQITERRRIGLSSFLITEDLMINFKCKTGPLCQASPNLKRVSLGTKVRLLALKGCNLIREIFSPLVSRDVNRARRGRGVLPNSHSPPPTNPPSPIPAVGDFFPILVPMGPQIFFLKKETHNDSVAPLQDLAAHIRERVFRVITPSLCVVAPFERINWLEPIFLFLMRARTFL